jgi:hypothetical protein
MDSAVSEAASWIEQFYITVNANGHGDVNATSDWYDAGSSFTVTVISPESAGSGHQYVANATSYSIPSVSAAETVTFTWTEQFYLTVSGNFGSVSPVSGWHNAGSVVDISASATNSSGERFLWNGWAGTGSISYSGLTNETSVTMNSPVSETASWTNQYSLTMATNYGSTSPSVGVSWHDAGSSLNVSASAPSAGTGERYLWNGWTGVGSGSYSGANNPTTGSAVTMNGPVNETASWTLQYSLTMATNYGTTSPSAGVSWHNAGSSLDISASAPSAGTGERYVWGGWMGSGSGSYSGANNPTTGSAVTMNGPVNETASWTLQYSLTMVTNYGTTSPTAGVSWHDAGSSLDITATAPTAGTGEKYVWNGWVGTGAGSYTGTDNPTTGDALTMSGPVNETASWTLQYSLTMITNYGTTSPTAGVSWHDAGSSLDISATAPTPGTGERYVWNGWTGIGSGSYTGTDNPTTGNAITINGPVNETASWALQYSLTMTTNYGTTSPSVGVSWHDAGSSLDVSASAPTPGTGERYVWNGWTGIGSGSYTGSDNPTTGNAVTMSGPVNETASWTLQYSLTMAANYGTTSPSVGVSWHDAGSSVDISAYATNSSGVRFLWGGWSGSGSISYSGLTNETSVTMDSAVSEAASWTEQFYLTVSGNFGSVSPVSGWHNAGSVVDISASATNSSGERFLWNGWAGTGSISYSGLTNETSVTMNSAISEAASWTNQYSLTMITNYGTTSPTVGVSWHNAGSSLDISASAPSAGTGERYVWGGWMGSGSGSYSGANNPTTGNAVTMNGPVNETASWTHQYSLTMITNYGSTSPSAGVTWHDASSSLGINATAPTAGTGERYVWNGWAGVGSGSYTGTNNPTTGNAVTMNGPVNETASWTHQYEVSFVVSPSGSGSTSPAGTNIWEDTGSIGISATANSGYSFSTWSSNTTSITFAAANSADTTATINGSGTITATFTLTTTTTYSVTFTQTGLPAGKSWIVTFNGVSLTSKTSTIVFKGIASGSYSWSVLTPIAGSTGIRYQAYHASGTMRVPSQTTQTITYMTQYLVTFAQSGVGSDLSGTLVTIDGSNYAANALPALWWNSSSSHSFAFKSPLVVTANGKQYVWASTTGLSTLQSTTFTVSAPGTINGHYQTQYWLTTSTNFGTVNPSSGWFNAGSTVTISATAPSTGSGERYVWHGWTGTGPGSYTGTNNPAIHAVTMNAAITETASWTHQYQVTVTASPTGAIGGTFAVTYTMGGTTYTHQQHNTPWTQWTDASTTVTVSSPQSPFKGYTFSSYTNDPTTMNSAQTITLMFYGALNHFVFNTIGTQTAGKAFSITITAKDAYGNTVKNYAGSTTLTETGGGAGGTVSPSSVTFTNGVYTGTIYVTKSGTGVTITATSGSTSSASNMFTVNPGALSTFVFNTISTQTAGKAFSITITAKDAYGNTVTGCASSVGISASTGGGTVTPASIGTSGWLNGVWTGSVTLTTAGSGVTITANDGSGHTGKSNPFIVRSH